MADTLTPVREAGSRRRGEASSAATARTTCGVPAVAAEDPSDRDYTAGDVDELARWERRSGRTTAGTARR
ncbi:hypothetical protein [Cellulosimicrobium cellulans]|uniref:hypothetical protein n=1 Tax=Cellulosimicrobium cellulans TaxID=1710 RepID=UPI0020CCB546|nr:hypothetical protein NMQ07_03785 [Cellulosimicrobium cellulans]